jgi:hypothetical protein
VRFQKRIAHGWQNYRTFTLDAPAGSNALRFRVAVGAHGGVSHAVHWRVRVRATVNGVGGSAFVNRTFTVSP